MTLPDPTLPAPEKAPRKRRKLLLLVPGGMLIAVAWLLVFRLPAVAQTLAPWVARQFGYELSIEHIERLDLTGLKLRGLRLDGDAQAGPLRQVQLEFLEVEYTGALLKGELGGLKTVHAQGLALVIDTQSEQQEDVSPAAAAAFEWPPALPVVDLTDARVTLLSEDDAEQLLEIESVQLDAAGALDTRVRLQGHRVLAQGIWERGVLRDLGMQVDGEALLAATRVDLVHVADGVIELDAQLPLGSESQQISVRLDGTEASWQASLHGLDLAELEARLPLELNLDLAGHVDLQTSGSLDWTDPRAGSVQLSLDVKQLHARGLDFQQIQGELQLKDGELRIPALTLTQSENNRGRIDQAVLPLQGLQLEELDLDDWLPRARAQLSVELTDLGGLFAQLQPSDAGLPDFVEHRLALRCELGDSQLNLLECGLQSAAGNLELSQASVDLRRPQQLVVNARGHANLHDLGAIGDLLGRSGWSGALEGDLDMAGEWPDVQGRLDLAGDNLLLEDVPLGHLELDMNSSAIGRELELTHLAVTSPEGSLKARMHFEFGERLGIRLQQLELQRGSHSLELQETVQFEMDAESGRVDSLVLDGTGGHISLQGFWDPGGFDVQFLIERLDPASLDATGTAPLFEFGAVNASLRATQRDGELNFVSSGSALQVAPAGMPEAVDLRWDITHEDRRLTITDLVVTGRDGLHLFASGELPLDFIDGLELPEGDVSFQLDSVLPLALLQEGGAGTLRAEGSLQGDWQELQGSLSLDGNGLRLAPEFYPPELASADLHGTLLLAEDVQLNDVSIHLGDWIQAELDARLDTSLDATRWLADHAAVLDASEIEGELVLAKLDIVKLRPLLLSLSEAATPLMEGQIESRCSFKGPLLSPELSGSLQVEGGRLRPGGGLPPVEALTLDLQLKGDHLEFRNVTGTLGAAPFTLDGELSLARGDDQSPQLDLQLQGQDLLLLRDSDARVRANTDLHITGPLSQLLVQGTIELTTGYYSPDIRFLNLRQGPKASGAQGFQLFALRDAPLRDMTFDIALGAKQPFSVHNSILRGSMRPELHLGGTGLVPLLTGTVYLEPTRLSLPAAQLSLTSGTVRFLEENPFVPELDILGKTRMLGYDIRADITGPYDEPELLLSSTPPLSQEDLFLLILTGRLPEDPDRNDALSTANTVAIYLARDTLARWFEEDGPIDEDTILERLEFSIGEDVSKNGTESFDVAFRLTSRAGKPQDTKDARHLYLATQRDKYEDYNFGVRWVFRFKR